MRYAITLAALTAFALPVAADFTRNTGNNGILAAAADIDCDGYRETLSVFPGEGVWFYDPADFTNWQRVTSTDAAWIAAAATGDGTCEDAIMQLGDPQTNGNGIWTLKAEPRSEGPPEQFTVSPNFGDALGSTGQDDPAVYVITWTPGLRSTADQWDLVIYDAAQNVVYDETLAPGEMGLSCGLGACSIPNPDTSLTPGMYDVEVRGLNAYGPGPWFERPMQLQ